MNEKRVSTGIHELDALLDGGFRRGKTYLTLGEPGTGKTIFALQFLHQALKDGEKALYVTIDEKPADLVDQAMSLGWDLTPHIELKNLLILDASALITARVSDISSKNDLQKIIVELNNHIAKSGATRVVIDPVGPLIHAADSPSKAQDQARTAHRFTAKEPPNHHPCHFPIPGPRHPRHRRVSRRRHHRLGVGIGQQPLRAHHHHRKNAQHSPRSRAVFVPHRSRKRHHHAAERRDRAVTGCPRSVSSRDALTTECICVTRSSIPKASSRFFPRPIFESGNYLCNLGIRVCQGNESCLELGGR